MSMVVQTKILITVIKLYVPDHKLITCRVKRKILLLYPTLNNWLGTLWACSVLSEARKYGPMVGSANLEGGYLTGYIKGLEFDLVQQIPCS